MTLVVVLSFASASPAAGGSSPAAPTQTEEATEGDGFAYPGIFLVPFVAVAILGATGWALTADGERSSSRVSGPPD
jgi:hypothetical protein